MNAAKLKQFKKKYKQESHHHYRAIVKTFAPNDRRYHIFDFDNGDVLGLTKTVANTPMDEMSDAIGYTASELGHDVYRSVDGVFKVDDVVKDTIFATHDDCTVFMLVPVTMPDKLRLYVENLVFEHRNDTFQQQD
ncbi:hypothetical protein [Lentilactobacillus sunkii]|uniref:Uncharacterized protein n=1 Tax=Lentilactobacillus sunkii DSM 19904 TaxID=1423808 RepID=A0A0R1KWA0_9LACO|nr:hypothetical protein [Lentilactobacillus sunkii]KRK88013.1 hypothetical protein FD17_GL000661 [Lentilactobacillus sunkii DSM 19904]